MLEPKHRRISLSRQCGLLGLNRSTVYYQPRPGDELNERLMRLIDEQYLRTPFYGVEQMRLHLKRLLHPEGIEINAKRVRRLMRAQLTGRGLRRHASALSRLNCTSSSPAMRR
ncbi:MAG: IS3 family transposase [Phycisphaerales bacterium]|jgi:putative transposase|nr:IS3 family transposase [Phycisphaerales bacterium]